MINSGPALLPHRIAVPKVSQPAHRGAPAPIARPESRAKPPVASRSCGPPYLLLHSDLFDTSPPCVCLVSLEIFSIWGVSTGCARPCAAHPMGCSGWGMFCFDPRHSDPRNLLIDRFLWHFAAISGACRRWQSVADQSKRGFAATAAFAAPTTEHAKAFPDPNPHLQGRL
jgi:hypothetical protein